MPPEGLLGVQVWKVQLCSPVSESGLTGCWREEAGAVDRGCRVGDTVRTTGVAICRSWDFGRSRTVVAPPVGTSHCGQKIIQIHRCNTEDSGAINSPALNSGISRQLWLPPQAGTGMTVCEIITWFHSLVYKTKHIGGSLGPICPYSW